MLTARPPGTTQVWRRRIDGYEVLAAFGLIVLLLAATTVGEARLGSGAPLIAPVFVVGALFLLVTPRVEISLAVIALYLGLVEGYLKLSTGSSLVPAGRDVIILAVIAGVLLRQAVTHERVGAPPYLAHVVLFAAFVLIQALSPNSHSSTTIINGFRQHLEFVPLFFLGFMGLRTRLHLRTALALLLAIGAANGIVGAVQGGLTPAQLASWGPGYSELVRGTDGHAGAGRTFEDNAGRDRVRPPALGSDAGAGGTWAILGIVAGLALLTQYRRRVPQALTVVGIALCVIGLLSGQARLSIVGAVVAVMAFALLTARTRERLRGLIVLGVGMVLIYGVVTLFASNAGDGTLDRYSTLGPSQLLITATAERGNSLAVTPTYLTEYFFGYGIGRAGPAAGAAVEGNSPLNAENAFNYLVGELGTVGMLILFALWLRVLWAAVKVVRDADAQDGILLAALVAPLFSFLVFWTSAVPMAALPSAPYFWAVAGAVAFRFSLKRHIGADKRALIIRAP